MKLKENSLMVYDYVVAHENENITAKDIAAATGLTDKQVNGIVTMAFVRHKEAVEGEDGETKKVEVPLMERIPVEVELDDGTHKKIKYIKLTEAGRNIEIVEAE